MKRLAIVTTHPIQYNAPLFKMMHARKNIEIKIFYTWSQSESGKKFDPGFGKEINWDVPLLEGYNYSFVDNVSSSPGSHHYKGIDNPTLTTEIKEWNADAILIYGWAFKTHLNAIRFFKGKIPVLFRGDSTLLDQKHGVRRIIRNIFLRYVYSYIDMAMYVGKANKEYFLEHGLKKNQLSFMPHAIENERFFSNKIIQANAINILKSLDIPKTALVFLFVGKLEIKKQPEILAKLFQEFNNNEAHLIIAGSGILEAEMKQNFGKFQNIHFLGFCNQNKMPSVYACCDVFVLPSIGPHETWGLAINEAMAAGKPLVVSDACGAASDLVHQLKNGFIFKRNDIEALREKLLFYLNNRNQIKKMGHYSLQIIKNYSYEKDCMVLESTVSNFNYCKL